MTKEEKFFWAIIEEGNASKSRFRKIFRKLTDIELLLATKIYRKYHDRLVDSKSMERVIKEVGYSGDYVDYMTEGAILSGAEFYFSALKSKRGFYAKEMEGVFMYTLMDELEERSIKLL